MMGRTGCQAFFAVEILDADDHLPVLVSLKVGRGQETRAQLEDYFAAEPKRVRVARAVPMMTAQR